MYKSFKNPFELSGNWYRANFHTHTTASEGGLSPADRVEQYRKAGYHVLAITDHNVTVDVSQLPSDDMLVISGMEYHPVCPTSDMMYHILALNIPYNFSFHTPQDAESCIAEVKEAGGESIFAHPLWSGHAFEDFKHLKGLIAVEVYNATCELYARACSENEWTRCLDHGYFLSAVANDDAHSANGEDLFQCWTWLKMPSLSIKHVLTALRDGSCYATCGPEIKDFRIKQGLVRLRCSHASKIFFSGGPGQGIRHSAKDGKSIEEFSIPIPNWPYIRAVVVDSGGDKAWTNPIVLKRDADQ